MALTEEKHQNDPSLEYPRHQLRTKIHHKKRWLRQGGFRDALHGQSYALTLSVNKINKHLCTLLPIHSPYIPSITGVGVPIGTQLTEAKIKHLQRRVNNLEYHEVQKQADRFWYLERQMSVLLLYRHFALCLTCFVGLYVQTYCESLGAIPYQQSGRLRHPQSPTAWGGTFSPVVFLLQ